MKEVCWRDVGSRLRRTANGKRELRVEKFLKMQNERIKTVQNTSDI